MSDWKSRAKPVDDWKARAKPLSADQRMMAAQADEEEPLPVEEPNPVAFMDPSSSTGAGVEHAVHGATSSFGLGLPTIIGAANVAAGGMQQNLEDLGVLERQNDASGQPAPREDGWSGILSRYRSARDATKKDLAAGERAHPALSAATELGGAMLTPSPVGKAKGIGLVPKLVQGVKAGALQGGASALANSDADVTKGELGGLLGDTALGTAAGGVAGGALAYGAGRLEPVLRKAAQLASFKGLQPRVALGGLENKVKALESKSPRGDPLAAQRQLGQRALDEGITMPFGTAEGAAKRAGAALDEQGQTLGGILQSIQDQNPGARVSLPAVATTIENAGNRARLMPGEEQYGGHLLNAAQRLRETASRRNAAGLSYLSLPEAEAAKSKLQRLANYAKRGPAEDARKETASAMRQAVEDEAERVAGPDELELFKGAKKKYGELADISEIGEYGAKRAARREGGGLASDIVSRLAVQSEAEPKHKLTSMAWNALADAWKERRPQTLASLYSAGAKGNQSIARGSNRGLAEYLQFLRNDDQENP